MLRINLKFWKKKDDLGLGADEPGMEDTPMPPDLGLGQNPPGFGAGEFAEPFPEKNIHQPNSNFPKEQPFTPDFNQPPRHEYSQQSNAKDFEVVIARLDAVKSQLESINQRLMRLEMLAERSSDQENPRIARRYAREY